MLSGAPARWTTSHSLMSSAMPPLANSGSVMGALQLPSGLIRLGAPSGRMGRAGGSVLNSNLGVLGRMSSGFEIETPEHAVSAASAGAAVARMQVVTRRRRKNTKSAPGLVNSRPNMRYHHAPDQPVTWTARLRA